MLNISILVTCAKYIFESVKGWGSMPNEDTDRLRILN